jgi:hypothetical protein
MTTEKLLFTTDSGQVVKASVLWLPQQRKQPDEVNVRNLRKAWYAALRRVDGEFSFQQEDPESYARRGLRCPVIGSGRPGKIDYGCGLPFCPYCWGRNKAISLWKRLYQSLHGWDYHDVQLVWMGYQYHEPRCNDPQREVFALRQWVKEDSPRKFGIDILAANGLRTFGSLSFLSVWPERKYWVYRHKTLLLVPRVRGLVGKLKEHPKWKAHNDWSAAGLIRLAGLLTQYPYHWLTAGAHDWKAFQDRWSHLRSVVYTGAFQPSCYIPGATTTRSTKRTGERRRWRT